MNPFEPITITSESLALIKRLAARFDSTGLELIINELPVEEQAQLFALYNLGRTSVRSYNVAGARRTAAHSNIAAMLAEKTNLATYLTKGLKRHAKGE